MPPLSPHLFRSLGRAPSEDIQVGRMSLAQGNAVLARKWSELVAENSVAAWLRD